MIRISKVCSRLLTLVLFSSGLSPRHMLMLKSLKAQGWRITVIAWNRNGSSQLESQYKDLVDDWKWIHLSASEWSGRLLFKLPRYYFLCVKKLRSNELPDMVFYTHICLLPFALLGNYAKIYDAAEMYSLDLSFYFGRLKDLVRPVIEVFEGIFVTRLNGVLTVDSKGGWLERFYSKWNRRVQVIWNVPSLADDPTEDEVAALANEYSGYQVIAYIGGLMREKGLRVAIESIPLVMRAHPNCLFLFIGPMKDDRDAVDTLIRERRVRDSIRFTGPLPYRQMLAHLCYAKVGLALHQQDRIYPYVSAGNGRKFFSYMQAGVPVIGPQIGEIGKAVQLADCGLLLDTEDVDAVASAIVKLLDEPDKAQQLGRNGRLAFEEKYHWEATEEAKFLSFLEATTT